MVMLTDTEQAMLDGDSGPATRKAMELLIRYADALGAERAGNQIKKSTHHRSGF